MRWRAAFQGDASQTWLGVVELLRRGQHVVSGLGRLQPRLREQILAVGEDFRMRLDGNPVLLTAELRAGPGRLRENRRCRVRFLDQRIEVDEDLSRFYTTALPYRAGPNLMISDLTGPTRLRRLIEVYQRNKRIRPRSVAFRRKQPC